MLHEERIREAIMATQSNHLPRILAALIGLVFTAGAAAVTVPISSSDGTSWSRSNGGTGTSMPVGGPGVWNSVYTVAIPPGATNISFALSTFGVDDKGVVQLNGSTIGDAVIFIANGGAAGVGTFDFGDGGGNQPYTYVGFTPDGAVSLPDGTTNFELIAYVNDTGSSNPSSVPFPTVTVASSFNLNGTLSYDVAGGTTPAQIPTSPTWSLFLTALLLGLMAIGVVRSRRLQ